MELSNSFLIYTKKIKSFSGYIRTVRHSLLVHAVSLRQKDEVDKILYNNPYLNENPFGNLDEFSCVYEFKKEEIAYKFLFGNYSDKDIKVHDLTPFQTKFNKDLIDNYGLMGRMEVIELDKSPTFGKFKTLLTKAQRYLSAFNLVENEK